MSEYTKVVFSEDARKALLQGLNATADAVGCTLGPRGKTVLIQNKNAAPIVTKDGVTVSKSIRLQDPLQRIGSSLVQEAASRTNEVAGDGTTTATVLTQAMVTKSIKLLTADMSSLSMKRGLDSAVGVVDAALRAQAKPVKGSKEINQVATISANNDEHIGNLIATAMEKVGRTGIITVEDAKGMKTSVELVEGMQFDRGYLSPYFVTDQEKMLTVYENVYVLVSDRSINDIHELLPILEQVVRTSRPLLLIADEVEGTAIQGLVLNRHQNNLPVVAIKAPGYGEHKNELLKDICVLTGGDLVSSKSGVSLKTMKLENLGTLKRCVVSKSSTTLVGDGSQKSKVNEHVTNLESQTQDVTLSPEASDKLRRRIAGLANGVAIIKVGGTTEIEMIERKYRIEDALHATKAAADEGIVPGGGLALLRCASSLDDMKVPDDEIDPESFLAGVGIVRDACDAPFKRIVTNAGSSFSSLKEKVPPDTNVGYDARKGVFVDMIDEGIIDPVKVTSAALKNAASVAATFLSLDAVVIEETEKNDG